MWIGKFGLVCGVFLEKVTKDIRCIGAALVLDGMANCNTTVLLIMSWLQQQRAEAFDWDRLDAWNGDGVEWNERKCGAMLSCMHCMDEWRDGSRVDGWTDQRTDVGYCDVLRTNSRIRRWALFENTFLPQNQPRFCLESAWSPNPWRHSSPTLWIVAEFPGCREAKSPPTRKVLPPPLLNHSEPSSHCHTNDLCPFFSQFFAAWRDAAWVRNLFCLTWIVEMLLKVYYLKLAYFKDLWNYLDPKPHNN